MTPTQLNHTAAVLAQMLTFEQPADVVLSNYLRDNCKLGRNDRHEIAETAFAALRHYQKIAAVLRRPAVQSRKAALAALILGRSVSISQIEDLLNNADNEKELLSSLKARKNEFSGYLNTAAELPSWLIARLQQHYTDEQILAFGRSVAQPAPLDVRVNTLNSKRDKALAQLQTDYPQAIATPLAPHGIRFPNKPALNQHPCFRRHNRSARRRQPTAGSTGGRKTRRNHRRFLRGRRRQNPCHRRANGQQRAHLRL